MSVDIFMSYGKEITGSSTDKAQTGNSNILAYRWGMSQSGSFNSGSTGGAGKVSIMDLSFTKFLDHATTGIMKYCCTGAQIPQMILLVRNAGGTDKAPGLPSVKITLSKVIVTSVATGASSGDTQLTENITLNFASFTFENFSGVGGVSKSEGVQSWDVTTTSASAS